MANEREKHPEAVGRLKGRLEELDIEQKDIAAVFKSGGTDTAHICTLINSVTPESLRLIELGRAIERAVYQKRAVACR